MRYQQPRSGGVAKGKPITRGLIYANSGVGTANALNGSAGVISGGPISSVVGLYGVANSMAGGSDGYSSVTSVVKSTGLDFTLFLYFRPTNLLGGGDRVMLVGDPVSDSGAGLEMSDAGAGKLGFIKSGIEYIALTGATALVVDKWYAIALTYKHATGAINCYVKDLATGAFRLDGTGTSTAAWLTSGSATNWSAIVKHHPVSFSRPGDYGPSAAFSRELSAFEARSLCDNPWQLFAPERPALSVFGPSGPVSHDTTGAMIGAGAAIIGASALTSSASTNGWPIGGMVALGVLGASPVGAAVTHDTTGALVGAGSTAAGSASRFRAFATSGVLTGQGSTIAGAANRFRAMSAVGVLTGPGSAIAGSANRFRAMASTGALVGPGSIVVGAASRFRAMASTGALVGQGSTIGGDASRSGAPPIHDTTGTLTGAGAAIVGSAAHIALHGSSGALTGQGTTIAGDASRTAGFASHDTTGALAGQGAVIGGQAQNGTASASFSQEIELRPQHWYVKRGKQIHIFASAQAADDFIDAQAKAEQAAADKTSRRARKRAKERVIAATGTAPEQTVNIDLLRQMAARFDMPIDLPSLIAQQDYARVMEIYARAMELQDEEDIEMLLLMA